MLFLLLAACDTLPEGDKPADTADTADTGFALTSEECLALPSVSFGACLSGVTADGAPASLAATVDGTVVSIARGTAPEDCGWDFGNDRLREGDEALVVTLADTDGATWTVGLDVPGLSDTFLAAGNTVSLRAAYDAGSPWTPDSRGLAFYDGQGGLLLAMEDAGWIDRLPLTDVEVAAGAAVCSIVDDPCGEYFRHDIEVTVGGAAGTAPYGGQADIGAFRVLHGGYDEFDGDTQCTDWIPNDIAVAVLAL